MRAKPRVGRSLFNNFEYFVDSEMITLAKQLEELNLYHNRLQREAVEVAAALPRLTDLVLARNPLGDLCGGNASVQINGQLITLK